jgi:hypothetical protein
MQEPIRFHPVCNSGVERWSKPRRFDFLDRLPVAPIADTELLHLAHYCPVVISLTDDGPRVLILLDPALMLTAQADRSGRWRPPYVPIALRGLPFWPGTKPAEVHVAPELVAEAGDEGFALLDASGDPSEQFATIVAWIERLQLGMRRLSEAVKVLVAADLLTPLEVQRTGVPEPTGYLTVSPDKLNALSNARVAALTTDRCLPLDLAAACLFSRRLLARQVRLQKAQDVEITVPAENSKEIDFVKPLDIGVKLDTSPLFSFELFSSHGSA